MFTRKDFKTLSGYEKYRDSMLLEKANHHESFKEFQAFVTQERRNFVNAVNSQKWDTEMRTASENLLIAFDQIKDKLFNP